MIILDIILILILLWAVYAGFRDGIAVQLGGLAGLFAGVYLASRFGAAVGGWLGLGESYASIVGFIIVLVVVIILIAVLGRLLRGLFALTGLQMIDKLGGVLLSVLKTGLILGLLLYAFDRLNGETKWVKEDKLRESLLYRPLIKMTSLTFPYIDMVREKLFDSPAAGEQAAEPVKTV